MKTVVPLPTHADRQDASAGGRVDVGTHGVRVDQNGLEVLDRDECLRLLATVSLCRVGVTIGALPAILPVNFVLRDDLVFIRSVEGRTLHAALRNSVVAVEADQIDAIDHAGWSVLVRGRSYEVTDPAQISAANTLGLRSWVGELDRLIAVHAHSVSGRRIVPSAVG